ncbi:MAG: NAD(P)-dependent oxidoreductase [Halioglobus sp.]
MDRQAVGFIGLGNIGNPVAKRLVTEQYQLHVYDLHKPSIDELVSAGAVACNSVADLASRCLHIGVCVRDDKQVEALLYGTHGILANASKGTVIAVHSTVTQANLLQWAEDARQSGLYLLDAPITGGAHRAADGTLCYMVGGDESIVERCRPLFATSAEKVVHAGGLGSGIALKLCNNFIQYAEFVAMAEATRLAQASGLSVDVLREVGLSNGVVNEQMHMFVSSRNNLALSCTEEQMAEFFGPMGALGQKDLQCALDTAADHGVSLPTAEYLRERIVDVFLARDESRPPSQ